MRCPACQVDLNENARRCPLCGGAAEDVPPLIEGVEYQDYPAHTKRPKPDRSLSAGHFLLRMVLAASLLLLWAGYRRQLPVAGVLASGIAVLTLFASSALLLVTLRHRQRRESHLVFLLIFAGLAAAELTAALRLGTALLPSACALGVVAVHLAVLGVLCGKGLGEELRARFYL